MLYVKLKQQLPKTLLFTSTDHKLTFKRTFSPYFIVFTALHEKRKEKSHIIVTCNENPVTW